MLKAFPLLLIAITLLSTQAKAGGIDCSKAAKPLDKAICASPELQKQDRIMAELYAKARISMFGFGPSGEIEEQKKWNAKRSECLTNTAVGVQECLKNDYQSRNLSLAYAAMPAAPEVSLQVLREQKIESEPFFEALVLFTSETDGTDWSQSRLAEKQSKILKLVHAFFADVEKDGGDAKPNKHFASELFQDASITKPTDILKSSRDFAGFLRAATFDTDATLPCGFVISHQALLEATNSYFGATPDNFIIPSNCATMSPPTPKYSTLLDQIWKGWPECEGTIRFGAYGAFIAAVDRSRSPSARAIEDFRLANAPKNEAAALSELAGVSPVAIKAAQGELVAYYVKYLKVTPDKSTAFAKAKMAEVLNLAQQCE